MTVGSGVAVDGAADPTGDALEGVQAAEALLDREVDERLQRGADLGPDLAAAYLDAIGRVAQRQASQACVGDDDVAAFAK